MKHFNIAAFAFLSFLAMSCDSGADNTPPEIREVLFSDSTAFIRPGRDPRPISMSLDVHDPDGGNIVANWKATGGSFKETGTLNAKGFAVSWNPPSDFGVYKIEISVKDGHSEVKTEKEISVTPSLFYAWKATVNNPDPQYSSISSCLFFSSDNVLSTIAYGSRDQYGNGGGYSSGYPILVSNYRYPKLDFTLSFPDASADSLSSNDRITKLWAEVAPDGTTMSVTLDLLKGPQRQMVLSRALRC